MTDTQKRLHDRIKEVYERYPQPVVPRNKWWLTNLWTVTHQTADGTKIYYRQGKLHNTNGPAVIYPDGSEMYYTAGDLHSLQKKGKPQPAIKLADGTEIWFEKGILKNHTKKDDVGMYHPIASFPDQEKYWQPPDKAIFRSANRQELAELEK